MFSQTNMNGKGSTVVIPLECGRVLSFFENESWLLEPDPLAALDDDDDFDEFKFPDELDRWKLGLATVAFVPVAILLLF